MSLRYSWIFAVVAGVAGSACLDKAEPDKGVLERDLPPGSDPAPAAGKADGGGIVVAVSLESPHPYANNVDRSFPITLEGRVPWCAARARVHFASIRTEARYDYVHVEGAGGTVQTFDGDHTNVWSDWVDLDAAKQLAVRLETDYSVTRDGFRVDAVEVEARVLCPAIAVRTCDADQLDLNPSRGVCACPTHATCVPDADVTLEHVIGGGFLGTVSGHRATGTTAYAVSYRPGQPDQVTAIGTIDHARLQAVVRAVSDAQILARSDVSEWSNWNETFKVAIGGETRTFTRPEGTFPTDDQQLIARVEELFVCGDGGALTCGAGYACDAGQCLPEPQGCVCPALYAPVCGVDGRTYSNGCAAGCADVAVRHDGECGIAGDACGGLAGFACADGFKCRYGASTFAAPFPDAGGACVAQTYCDAPSDCTELPHVAVPGAWACAQNACEWRAGAAWQAVAGWAFVTDHPYGNRASQWMKLDARLPYGALRLVAHLPFELERNYDFLEVYARDARGEWVVIKRYTGTTAPALTDELVGREFWLRLATDASVTRYGFDLTAEWRY